MSDKLNQAITVIKAGDQQTGRQLLIEILKSEPHNENAWLWMTQVVSKKDEKIKCLERVLKINPNSEIAKQGMTRLRQVEKPNLDDIAPETNPSVIQRKKRERTESTFTTIGFSHFEAQTPLVQTLTSIEALLGIAILALLMFTLGNRISRS